jgi:hypothetical protein
MTGDDRRWQAEAQMASLLGPLSPLERAILYRNLNTSYGEVMAEIDARIERLAREEARDR